MKEKKQHQQDFGTLSMDKDFEIFHYQDHPREGVERRMALHQHNFYELYFLISGSVTYQMRNALFSLNPGDVLLFHVNQPHCPIFTDHEKLYERIVLRVSPSVLQAISTPESNLCSGLEEEYLGVYRFTPELRNNVRLLLSKLMMTQEESGFGSDLLRNAYLAELFVIINRYHLNAKGKGAELSSSAKKSQLIEVVNHYIDENLDKPLCIDDLCEQVYLSKYYFMRFFKEMTGTSVYRYIMQKRIMGAIQLMEEGIPVTTAYLQCGFGDYSCFFRAFKKQFGYPPTQYLELDSPR